MASSSTIMPPSSSSSSSSGPPCRVIVRSKTKVELFTVPERSEKDPSTTATTVSAAPQSTLLVQGNTSLQVVTPDGTTAFFLLPGHGVVACPLVLDALPREPLSKVATSPFLASSQNVQMMDVSPLGTFLITWERWNENTCPHNLKVWLANTGALVASFPQKSLSRDAWPYLHFTYDEKLAFLLVTNEVRIYTKQAFLQQQHPSDASENNNNNHSAIRYFDKVRISGVTSISVPLRAVEEKLLPHTYYFTSFCPATKDQPAKAALYEYRASLTSLSSVSSSESAAAGTATMKVSKSLFRAEEMKVHWSPIGDAALITLATSVDATGESYYGSSQLFLLQANAITATTSGKKNNDDGVLAVPLPQEGPVHSVQWMPHPDKPPCFVVVAGKMPALSSLHHGQTGQALFLFGNAHRNTVAWAPHGRFLLLAGFGNLAGGMGFWDRNKLKLIPSAQQTANVDGTLRVDAVVGYQWSPDSRWLVTSTTSPRMNVDNGLRLFRYNGDEVVSNLPWNNQEYAPDQLLQVAFVPALLTQYPDRPQSPLPEQRIGAGTSPATAAPSITTATAATTMAPPKPAGKYVPPSARNRASGGGGGTSLAERMRREREGTMLTATKVEPKSKLAAAVGAAGTPKSVLTGKAIPGLAVEAPSGKSKSALKREKAKLKKEQEEARQKEKEKLQESEKQQQQQQPASESEPQAGEAAADAEKRARKIKKTLKQINELKQRDPSELDEGQKAKVASESSLLEEVAQLGV